MRSKAMLHLLPIMVGLLPFVSLCSENLEDTTEFEPSTYHPIDNILMERVQNLTGEFQPIPDAIRRKIKPGVQLWDLVLDYHRTINAHHNYSTEDRQTSQEIGLDFFSSALVSCKMTGNPITAGRVKMAFASISKWPNFEKSSDIVKEGVLFVRDCLYRAYGVTGSTAEEEIPGKPYDVVAASARSASPELLGRWIEATGCVPPPEVRNVHEKQLLIDTSVLLAAILDPVRAKLMWTRVFPLLAIHTEMKKWISEVYDHKQLVFNFHLLCKGRPSYEVSDQVAANHDNDKYYPIELLVYALQWYYGDTCLYTGIISFN